MDEFFNGKQYKKTLIKGSELVSLINSFYDKLKDYPISVDSAREIVRNGIVKADTDIHLCFNTFYEENGVTYGGCSLLFYDSAFEENTLEYECQKVYKSEKNAFNEDVKVESFNFCLFTNELKIYFSIDSKTVEIYAYVKESKLDPDEHADYPYFHNKFDRTKFPLKEDGISDFYILDDEGWYHALDYILENGISLIKYVITEKM